MQIKFKLIIVIVYKIVALVSILGLCLLVIYSTIQIKQNEIIEWINPNIRRIIWSPNHNRIGKYQIETISTFDFGECTQRKQYKCTSELDQFDNKCSKIDQYILTNNYINNTYTCYQAKKINNNWW